MDITPETVAQEQHKDWLQHPTTRQLLFNLEKHKQSFVRALSAGSGNTAEPEISFRLQAYGIRTVDGIVVMITNTNKFLEQTNK
jgi:hypothetical protein